MAQVDAFSKEVLGNQYEKRVVIVDELVANANLYFPNGTVVYDRATQNFYKVTGTAFQQILVPEVVHVFFAPGWPVERPLAKSVSAIGGSFPPTWLTSNDLWFEDVP